MRQLTIALTSVVAGLALSASAVAKGNAATEAAKVNAIEANVLVVGEQPQSVLFHKQNVLTVSVMNNSASKVVFRIKNEDNAVIYSSRSKDAMFHQRVSTKSMQPGRYQAVVLKGKEEIQKIDFQIM